VQAPQFEGVENVTFPTFVMGLPITNETQINNNYYLSDGLSRVLGSHTFKFGGQFHLDQVNEHPNATFNGTFNSNGTETGNPYADLLLGTPSNFTQSSGQPFYLRNRYFGAYAQDSWRARNNLTINAGLPWWEKYNQIQTYVAGAESTLYPGAPPGFSSLAIQAFRGRSLPPATRTSLQNRACVHSEVRSGLPREDLPR
jgi:hypothetical protein